MHDIEQTKQIKYNLDYYVVQANELIRGKQDELTLLEAKLVRLAISQILQYDKNFKTYTCHISDLAKFLEIDKSNIYKEVENLITNLMRKVITIRKFPDKNGNLRWVKFHWVSTAQYDNGEITIKLSDELAPYLIGLDELFTKYTYSSIIALPTVYAIRMYELLVSHQSSVFKKVSDINFTGIALEKNEIAFSIEYLREYFNCEDKYNNASDFIKRIIEPSIKAINEKTVSRFCFRKVKKGRSITHIIFNVNNW